MSHLRKYLDKDRTVVNPAWMEKRESRDMLHLMMMGPGSHGVYFPEGKAIPAEGCWIRVIDVPHTELAHRFDVPVMSMWRARPGEMSGGGSLAIGGKMMKPQLAIIQTPGGDLWLYAHEYVIVDDIDFWVGSPEYATMHDLGGDPFLSDDQELQVFYVMSRGISRTDALLMILPSLTSQSICWFSMSDEVVEQFAGVGVPLWRHIALSERSA